MGISVKTGVSEEMGGGGIWRGRATIGSQTVTSYERVVLMHQANGVLLLGVFLHAQIR